MLILKYESMQKKQAVRLGISGKASPLNLLWERQLRNSACNILSVLLLQIRENMEASMNWISGSPTMNPVLDVK
jgi:hypothetical protein